MDGRIVKRILSLRNTEETCALLKGLGTKPRHIQKFLAGLESPRFRPLPDNIGSKGRTYSGNIAEKIWAGCIEIYAYRIDTMLHGIVKFLPEKVLVHIILILADAKRLRINLDQFRKRVHEPAAD